MTDIEHSNCYVEVSKQALASNTGLFKRLAPNCLLMIAVKADAYGHGMVQTAHTVLKAGADWLGVFKVQEGLHLRSEGIKAPVLVLGPVTKGEIKNALVNDLKLTVPDLPTLELIASQTDKKPAVHLKIETGANRQGLARNELKTAIDIIKNTGIHVEGAYTHFANIEDTTNHDYAKKQSAHFTQSIDMLISSGVKPGICHTASTAASILFDSTHYDMLRVGIGAYGLWPSKETLATKIAQGKRDIELVPAMSFKTRISGLRLVKKDDFIGYGCTYKTTRNSQIAVLPVGYCDGYDRKFSDAAHVLIHGKQAPVRGRICMNMTMADVTDIENVQIGDEVVLLGKQGKEEITAEYLADLASTINYEIVTRIAPSAPRIFI